METDHFDVFLEQYPRLRAGWGYPASLDCPRIGPSGAVSNLLSDVQVKLLSSGNSVDLANKIYDLTNKLQTERAQFLIR
jgi:hypothetical protein